MTTKRQIEQMYQWIRRNPFRFMWHNARSRANRDSREFTITEEDVRQAWPVDGCCPALGIPLVMPGMRRRSGVTADAASLDRIDNSRGYTPGNIAIISRRANSLKGRQTAAGLTVAAAAAEAATLADELARIAAWLERCR
jgi:hypothetical protein